MLPNIISIQAHEAKLLVVLAAVGFLRQLAVTAQVGEVDFATYQQNCPKQRQQKLLLRFVREPILANRACKIVFIARGQISPYALGDQGGYLVQSRSDTSAQVWLKPVERPDVVVISGGCDCRGMRNA